MILQNMKHDLKKLEKSYSFTEKEDLLKKQYNEWKHMTHSNKNPTEKEMAEILAYINTKISK